MSTFKDFGLDQQLLDAIKRLGYDTPTQIQEKSIPHVLKGEDVIAESATGSGKTLAFGCAMLQNVSPGNGLQALVLVPTRELAEQVKESLIQISYGKSLNLLAVYGGVSLGPQISKAPKADVVVATPGRLLDLMSHRAINCAEVKILVLDEADRMFDMGFIDDVKRIIGQCTGRKQTLLFSATIGSSIKNLAGRYMKNPVSVSAVKQVDPSKLKQVYYDIPRNMKISLLAHLLENERSGLVMVFCNTRRTTDFVAKNLKTNGISAIPIHGGLSQNKRTNTIRTFSGGKVGVLVCTDVAARGLHIDNVSHIYNYEVPKDSKDYVHRIGRTARAGGEGIAVNLLADYDHDNFGRILRDHPSFNIPKLNAPYVKRIEAVRMEQDSGRRMGGRPGGRPMGNFGRRPSQGRFGRNPSHGRPGRRHMAL